jgi:hypothetical protein
MHNKFDLQNLLPMTDFWFGYWIKKYQFSTDEWPNEPDEAMGLEQMTKNFEDTHPDGALFFQVDPEDGETATIVLRVRFNTPWFWPTFNEFLQEFGGGDMVEAQQIGDMVYFFLWYD